MKNSFISNILLLLVALSSKTYVAAFSTNPVCITSQRLSSSLYAEAATGADPQEVIGKTIKVKGDVNGGYVRTCIKNEASKFRRLIGTMSPPSDDDTATIYVEGKRKMVDGFVRWCQKGSAKVGLSQKLELVETTDEVPTGLYDGFYVKMEEDSE